MNYGAVISYESGNGVVNFCKDSPFWLTASPDIASVQTALDEMQSAGQIGTTVTSQSIQAKRLTFTGTLVGDVPASRAQLLRVVAPGQTARVTYAYGGRSYYMDGVPLRTPEISSGIVAQDFQFTLHAPYPYWRDAELRRININTAAAGTMSTTTIVNDGNVPAEFTLELYAATGAVNVPKFLLLHSEGSIQISRAMAVGEKMVVSTEWGKKGALFTAAGSSTAVNGFKYLSLNSDLSLTLLPGENVVQFSATSGLQAMQAVLVTPRGVYSGV